MNNEPVTVPSTALSSLNATPKRPYAAPAVTHLGAWTALTLAISSAVGPNIFEGLTGKV